MIYSRWLSVQLVESCTWWYFWSVLVHFCPFLSMFVHFCPFWSVSVHFCSTTSSIFFAKLSLGSINYPRPLYRQSQSRLHYFSINHLLRYLGRAWAFVVLFERHLLRHVGRAQASVCVPFVCLFCHQHCSGWERYRAFLALGASERILVLAPRYRCTRLPHGDGVYTCFFVGFLAGGGGRGGHIYQDHY